MTSETRNLIELSDVLGLQLECGKCGSKTIRSFAKFQNAAVRCDNCHEAWFSVHDLDRERNTIFGLIQALNDAETTLKEMRSRGIKLNVRLELAAHIKDHTNG